MLVLTDPWFEKSGCGHELVTLYLIACCQDALEQDAVVADAPLYS